MTLIYNATFDKNTRKLSFEDRAGNEIYSFTVPSKELVDDITKPLTFRATQDGSTVKLSKTDSPSGDFQTSTDGGNTWTDYTLDTAITLNTGDEVSFRAKADRTNEQYTGAYFYFTMGGKIEAWHNVMSLYRTNDFATYNTAGKHWFINLFHNCTSLTKAPVLPATTLAEDCYSNMFDGCQSLTEAPELPATTLDKFCYWEMFKGCQSLKEVRVSATKTAMNALYGWLSGVSATGDFYCDPNATIFPTDSTSGIPKGWRRLNIDEEDPGVDDITKPLTFRATQNGSTVKLAKGGSPTGDFQTSRDGGNTWADYTIDTAIPLNIGDEVSFRSKSDRTSEQSSQNYFQFMMEGKIEAWHNVMSMLRTNDFATYESVVQYAFRSLFSGCTSLTKAPALPATTLASDCYSNMFKSCTSLTKAPELPATTLAGSCYRDMFNGCTSLTKAPELPATTLAGSCYLNMFKSCASLIKAPALPATTLAYFCYDNMFYGCSNLNEMHCKIPSTISAEDISSNYAHIWLKNVSSTGTFYTNEDANWPSGASGIPTRWTRVNA